MNCICLKLGEKKSILTQLPIYSQGYEPAPFGKKKKGRFPNPIECIKVRYRIDLKNQSLFAYAAKQLKPLIEFMKFRYKHKLFICKKLVVPPPNVKKLNHDFC